MHWGVVEVKPEPDRSLYLRFKDGLSGRVRLRPEDLTGVLAPIRDSEFFNAVFRGMARRRTSLPMHRQVASQPDRQRQAS